MKTLISLANQPVTVRQPTGTLAEQIVRPLELMTGSLSHDLMVGAISYVLSMDKYKFDGGAQSRQFVAGLRKAVKTNKLILDRALQELSDDVEQPPR